jgi:hypothetical protein
MKKIVVFVLALVVLFTLLASTLELDNKNLKGLKYLRIQCEFNGIPYFKGYKCPKDREVVEYNAREAEDHLHEAGVPLSKDKIRAVYNRLESRLSQAGVQIVKIKNQDEKGDSTILPTVSINVEVLPVTEEQYVTLVYLTVSKWMSTWSGTENINTPVITWWQKTILVSSGEELNRSVEKAANALIADFLAALKAENKEVEKKEVHSLDNRSIN